MATRYISRFSLVMIFTLTGCSLFQPEEIGQEILFEYNRTNWAWGYTNYGAYMDRRGDVYSYRYGDVADEPWKPKKSGEYSERELLDKYAHNKTYLWTVNADTLLSMYNLIDEAAQGPYSDTTSGGADMGGWSINAYQYETKSSTYIRIRLQLIGDWRYKNESRAADMLIPWLALNLGAGCPFRCP